MEAVLAEMDALVDATRESGVELANTERAYKVKFARARMTKRAAGGKFTVDSINDEATVECDQELFDYTIAQQTMHYTREALRAGQTKIDALRTMSASIRGAGG